ncbi:MAG: TatD family hydrolase [Pseudomonadota bacterium]
MFDTHVNLHGEPFADDLEATLQRARDAGVRRFLAICDRLDNFDAIHAIASAHPDIWCSAGIHPHHAKDFTDLTVETLSTNAASDKVVAIGETGLDFHYGYSEERDQVRSLRLHIEAARQTGLPLILHTREADDLMGDILESEFAKGAFQPLLHCYTGGARLAARGLALGAYVSVSGILSFKNAHDVRAVIKDVPLDRVILETDCPYLAPVPFRGRRNEPAYLPHVAQALADLHDMDVENIKRTTEANALRLFRAVP